MKWSFAAALALVVYAGAIHSNAAFGQSLQSEGLRKYPRALECYNITYTYRALQIGRQREMEFKDPAVRLQWLRAQMTGVDADLSYKKINDDMADPVTAGGKWVAATRVKEGKGVPTTDEQREMLKTQFGKCTSEKDITDITNAVVDLENVLDLDTDDYELVARKWAKEAGYKAR